MIDIYNLLFIYIHLYSFHNSNIIYKYKYIYIILSSSNIYKYIYKTINVLIMKHIKIYNHPHRERYQGNHIDYGRNGDKEKSTFGGHNINESVSLWNRESFNDFRKEIDKLHELSSGYIKFKTGEDVYVDDVTSQTDTSNIHILYSKSLNRSGIYSYLIKNEEEFFTYLSDPKILIDSGKFNL